MGLLHCIGLYPTENRYQNLNFLYKIIKRYPNCTLGYSGHEAPENLDVVKVAIGVGAKIIERHVGIPTKSARLNGYSMNPEETRHWVQAALEAKKICGSNDLNNKVTEDEVLSLRSLSRGVFAKRKITTGEVLDKNSIFFAMPCKEDQTSVSEYLMTMKASKDYAPNEALIEKRHYDPIQETRNVVHEAKGLLREAQIPFGSDYRIELSHHYGMTNFRRQGAILINYFNREYCKKIIILLPGQSHPPHTHKKKEETFQLLYGEMMLTLEDQIIHMMPGDFQLIKSGEKHEFSTNIGCVFEEISTTHRLDDSFYEDEDIQLKDPILRKTIIENW